MHQPALKVKLSKFMYITSPMISSAFPDATASGLIITTDTSFFSSVKQKAEQSEFNFRIFCGIKHSDFLTQRN